MKSLILCATSARYEPGPLLEGFKAVENTPIEDIIQGILPFMHSRAFIRKLKKDQDFFNSIKEDTIFISPMRDPTRFQDYMNQAAAMEAHDTRELLNKITVPTLIFGASKDRMIPIVHQEFLHEKIPNSKLEIIEGCGHGFTLEEPEKVNELMWNFIKENI